MDATDKDNDLSFAATLGAHCTDHESKKLKPRSILILFGLFLLAVGLIVIPKPPLYYPNIVITTPNSDEIDFLLNPKQTENACQQGILTVVNSISSTCQSCAVVNNACLKNPSTEITARFGTAPLLFPSVRFNYGSIVYRYKNIDEALHSCLETIKQAGLRGDDENMKMVCYPAGQVRPGSSLEQAQKNSGFNFYTNLLFVLGALLVTIIGTIFGAYRYRCSKPKEQLVFATYPRLEKLTMAGSDVLMLIGTFAGLAWPASDDFLYWSHFDRSMVIGHGSVVLITVCWFWLFLEHYTRRRPFWDELQEILRVLFIMSMVSGSAAFIVGIGVGVDTHLLVWVLNLFLLPFGRWILRQILDDLGLWRRPVVIVGTGSNARDAWLAVSGERNMGYKLLGFVEECSGGNGIETEITIGANTYPVIKREQLESTLSNIQIIVALDSLADEGKQALVQRLVTQSRSVHLIPSIRGLPLFGTQLSHFFSHEVLLLTLQNNLGRRGYKWIKRIFDLALASFLLLLLAPLFLYLSFKIRKDGGSAFFGHSRVGQGGKPFKCLKFRSMHSNAGNILKELLANDPVAKAEWDRDFKLKNDPRITPVGHFIRKTSLDELPQLINVIKGEMSLVGPRPVVQEELERYGESACFYLEAKPGITGLWQVSGRNDTTYSERVSLDSWYVQNWSLWYDITILFKTIDVVLNRRGAY